LNFHPLALPSGLLCSGPVYFSFFIRFYLHLCSFFCLFVPIGHWNKGREKEPPFSLPEVKQTGKEKDHETKKNGFKEEPSPEQAY
jgi:hypothetical protein